MADPTLLPRLEEGAGDEEAVSHATGPSIRGPGRGRGGGAGFFVACVGNLDQDPGDGLIDSEEDILRTIGERIEAGKFDVPSLPQTIMTALDLTSNPLAEVGDIVGAIEKDPVLSAELLKTANSVMFAGVREAQTHREAVVRLGQRNLRTLILSLAMRELSLFGILLLEGQESGDLFCVIWFSTALLCVR